MKKVSEYILLTLMVCLFLLPSCRRAKIMSEKEMSDIYAEMFLADQWLNDNPTLKRTADTTKFYESIFRKFGYDFEDYDASVNYYLRHPEKYRKIVERSKDKLRATSKALEEFEAIVEKQNKILEGLGVFHLPVFSADSIKVDTSMLWSPWKDTLAYRDSLLRDSLSRDSLRLDSLRRDSLRRDSLRVDSLKRNALRPLGTRASHRVKRVAK